MNEDFARRKELMEDFVKAQEETNTDTVHEWDRVCVAAGLAEYDAAVDATSSDTFCRADKKMYENKRIWKEKQDTGKQEA